MRFRHRCALERTARHFGCIPAQQIEIESPTTEARSRFSLPGVIVDASDDSNSETNSCKVSISSPRSMLKALFSLVFAAVMWVQVPQWQPDWSQCSVVRRMWTVTGTSRHPTTLLVKASAARTHPGSVLKGFEMWVI